MKNAQICSRWSPLVFDILFIRTFVLPSSVNWVQPRVLHRQQIGQMAEQLREWCTNVDNIITSAQTLSHDDLFKKEE